MKTKNVNNNQEKCDEWLSTRNKKKISKPIPMIKKHSAARSFVKSGSSSKICKLTQNSLPPPQIFTNTKQSVLMSYFTSKPDSRIRQNQSFDDFNDFDVDMHEELTEQFGFLSSDESNEKERHQNIPLSHPRVTKNNSAKCQVECDIDASNDDSDDCKMSERFKLSPKCDKNVINVCARNNFNDSDIEFISQSNAEQTRNVEQKNNFLRIEKSNSKTDTDSDIEFISQCPNSVEKYVNPPKSTGKSSINEHNSVEKCRKTFSKVNENSKTDTDSDIEFISQCPKNFKNVNPLKSTGKSAIAVYNTDSKGHEEDRNSKTDTDSDIEFISQCPKTVEKYVHSPKSCVKLKIAGHEKRFNKDFWKNKFQADTSGDDIVFLSQCPEQKSRQMDADLSVSKQIKHLNSKRCQSSEISEPDSDCSEIEFYSQIPELGRYNDVVPTVPENTQEFSRQVPKNYEKECRHSVKNRKLKCNIDPKMDTNAADNDMECVPEIPSEGSEIEFISQSVLQNPETFSKFCDSVDSTNHFQNHTLNVTLNTEELDTPQVQDLDFDSQEDDSCSTDTLEPEEQNLVEQCPPNASPSNQGLVRSLEEQSPEQSKAELSPQHKSQEYNPTNDLSFDFDTQANNNYGDTSTNNQKQKQNKGGNSLRHKSRLLQKFLPDTIKFTDTESDSCKQTPQKTTRSAGKLLKKSFDLGSDVFTMQDSQPINVHINHSKRKTKYGHLQTKQF